ncbi:flagellar assembly protein FliW [Metabacillus halosaccharovorans]|uniref:Flagellar assembly factor FliW n=1 Tax=Metabacillus halosaccharovorans TaxID=930124 RepID=A0ABT3DC93_9BACI|nr:flagellar assembly protein FliW [Metabacillus halosaccharovorans]MCV9884677.1 flagellar assembly protein FliW [Metabacillus halosaccharovorans]
MNIQTKYHGEIQVNQEDIITFEQGIPGFPHENNFILLPLDQESPFIIMQSQTTPELGFVVVNPFLFFQEYEFNLLENDKEVLKINAQEDIQILSILTVKEPFSESTANLQAPVIINHKEKLAKQIILNNTTYTTRHRIIQEEVKK